MAKRSRITKLPPDIKAWLDTMLQKKGFQDYTQITEELNTALEPYGFSVSRSSVHRYGSDMQEKFDGMLEKIKVSTEMAKGMAEATEDDANHLSQSLVKIAQQKIFEILMLSEKPEDAARLTKAIADLSRAGLSNSKYARQIREEERQKAFAEAAATAEASMKQQGLSSSAIDAVKRDLLGISA
mgnify:FL=1